jgi:hypothetical protein
MSRPGITMPLNMLEHAEPSARGREAPLPPGRLQAGRLMDVADRDEHDRCFWDKSFGRLAEYLVQD